MGDHEGWVKPPSGLFANGLLPHKAVTGLQVLKSERWLKAEERAAELIACIQPNVPSEERRNAVADYVKRLIMQCFPCEVFTFGSVPLKTYLPDGDIDLTAFSENQNLKDTWAHLVRDMLEDEEKNEKAEFRVKEVQYIQAEVKIIKCLVENIVVDISFNQLGGLCTLCFLEEADHLINHNYLFKRSIILIKAWCYYESRILGAHHGLISTYALEALVLYMFHVYNNFFSGPLEVLYRFLEFFSKFDWDNFCVSLWGPVPISSLPDITAKPPRMDGGDLLLSKEFLQTRSSMYAVFPGGQESQGQPYVSKHFNVIDPLRVNNNLGRSVSKGNFFRIRSAFAFGAKRLAKLLECPGDDLVSELDQFFMNTWERHDSGHRPDAARDDPCNSRLPRSELENHKNKSRNRKNDVSSMCENQDECVGQPHSLTSRQSTSRQNGVSTFTCMQAQSSEGDHIQSTFDQSRKEINANQSATSKSQQCSMKDMRGRLFLARTRSSPELTDAYGKVSSLVKRNKAQENVKTQTSLRKDSRASTDFPSATRHVSSRKNLGAAVDVNNFRDELESSAPVNARTKGIHEEEHDPVSPVESSVGHDFNGGVNIPLTVASGRLQFPIDSMGFGQRDFSGMVPGNVPLIETPWGANVRFPQGLVSSQLNHYFSTMGLNSSLEDHVESINENFSCTKKSSMEADDEFWHEQDRNSIGRFDVDNVGLEMPHSDDKLQSTSGALSFSPSRRNQPGNYNRVQQKFTKENRAPINDGHVNHFKYQNDTRNEMHLDDRTASSRSSPVGTGRGRSQTSSESSLNGSSAKVSKSLKEKRGRKPTYLVVPSSAHGKGRSGSEQLCCQPDDENIELESSGPQPVSSLHIPRVEVPGYEMAQSSGSEAVLPLGPMLLGPPSQHRGNDNAGVVPFTFYPTGPPVPFVTMLPFCNFSADGTSDISTSRFGGDELLESDSGQKFEKSIRHDQPELLSSFSPRIATSIEPADPKGDILNSDFSSHLQNLQYGRFCQGSRSPSVASPSPIVVPPGYLQGHYPWDGPGRPLPSNMSPITLGYGSRVVAIPPFQPVSNRPATVFQRYANEMPRYRSGTGTYLPNPKVASFRDRSGQRGHYSVGDHQSDKEDNWNVAKSRGGGRNHGRNQAEKVNLRVDRTISSANRAERPWGSRHQSNSNRSSSSTMAYGMYPLPGLNANSQASSGPNVHSVVMLYPCDQNTGYTPTQEQLEFGSLGPIGYSSISDTLQVNEVGRMGSAFDDQRFHGKSLSQQSPPDQPSSPIIRGE